MIINKNFIVKQKKEMGVNWCNEIRRYYWYPTFRTRFGGLKHEIVLENFGEFYFPNNANALPTNDNNTTLEEFFGEGIFEWVKENTIGGVLIYCRRDYGMSDFGNLDKHEMTINFQKEADAMAFKLQWM